MELVTGIQTRKTKHSRLSQVNFDELEFGKYISDHMLVCDYYGGQWQGAQIVPFAHLSLSPASLALHYGQTVFEGMKAFRMNDGRINIFRIEKHYDRFTRSLDRMCMAIPPKEIFMEGLNQLIELDRDWVPAKSGSALYIRPFMYASEARFGIKVSEEYRMVIFTGPVPELYSAPIKVKVETHYIRAARGGTGAAKCGGNYGAAFLPTQEARKQGYDQVLWTNGLDDPFIEESGMMNVMFVIDNILLTPPLSDSILDGVTRDSLLTLARAMGLSVEERPISVNELENALKDRSITEVFGAGTAAVVAPISTIAVSGIDYLLPVYGKHSVLNQLKDKLQRIRLGQDEDLYNWNYIV